MKPPIYSEEKERMDAVHRLGILDTKADPRFDAITQEALFRLKVPISTISIIDENREWYKSCMGVNTKEGPRDIAFCSWAMLASEMFIVEDTLLDERFKNNPYVVGPPYIRFYAGIRIIDNVSGQPIGVFCVKDIVPRSLSMNEIQIIMDLGAKAAELINFGNVDKN